ncbi:hypothetical protein [Brucella cytisi]|uniref:hypothetical protein n=1 Tax=Brucella cytisi TaxID=407152 RepID=UPI0035D82E19
MTKPLLSPVSRTEKQEACDQNRNTATDHQLIAVGIQELLHRHRKSPQVISKQKSMNKTTFLAYERNAFLLGVFAGTGRTSEIGKLKAAINTVLESGV